MSHTGLATFDSTVQTTNTWLGELMDELGWDDRQRAYHAMRAVLHGLRDRLTVDEGAHLSAQLPMLIRGIYYEGWRPAELPSKERTKNAFFQHIASELDTDLAGADTEQITRAVFEIVQSHITPGEADNVKLCLPAELKELWP